MDIKYMGMEDKKELTAEEIAEMQKKGEAAMTRPQEALSKKREYSTKTLKEMGVSGYLEHIVGGKEVFGIINGHKIHLFFENENSKEFDSGEIDGVIKLNAEETQRFFKKYNSAIVQNNPEELEKAENSSKESVLEDIGL